VPAIRRRKLSGIAPFSLRPAETLGIYTMSRKRRNNETPSRVMFVMDMCNQPVPSIEAYEAEFQTAGPDLLRDAGRIERDFIP